MTYEGAWARALGSRFSGAIITVRMIYTFIGARARKQLTMFYHVRVTLLCAQCLHAGICSLTLSLPYLLLIIQWNLHNTDTIGTPSNCPYYGGVLSSEVVQATPLN